MTEPRQLRYRAKHPEKVKAWKRAHYWRHRERLQRERAAKAERNRATARTYRQRPEVQERIREKQRAWREAHPGYQVAWAKTHPEYTRTLNARRRALRKGAPTIERVDAAYIYKRDRGRCHICGKAVTRKEASLDHLIPLSRGGEHTAQNIALAHRRCNSSRGAGRLPAQLRLLG